jgi:hypothetical protein
VTRASIRRKRGTPTIPIRIRAGVNIQIDFVRSGGKIYDAAPVAAAAALFAFCIAVTELDPPLGSAP